MKHPVLFDVPKDSPTRKEKLDAFKAKHDIWTHCANHESLATRWCALWVKGATERLNGYLDAEDSHEPMDLIAGYCRILDEADLLVSGKTELEVVRSLCEYNGIPFDL